MEQREIENLNRWHVLKYLIFTENPDNEKEIYTVNLLTGKFNILSREEFNYLFKFNELKQDDLILKKFIRQGFIINFNEYEFLKSFSCNSMNKIYKNLKITICPTLNCNFNCPYCFENHKIGKMSLETQDNILILIEKLLDILKSENIHITWFGGEPLLGLDVIESLSNKIIKLTENKKISYNSSIITNGYLLTQENVDLLYKLKVQRYQITLDGFNSEHNLTRHLINNEPTFEKILNNIKTLNIKGIVNIRCNIYKDNLKNIEKAKDFFNNLSKESKNQIKYYFAVILDNKASFQRKNYMNFLTEKESNKIEILSKIKKLQFKSLSYCMAHSLYNITIDHEGNLYKCWEDVCNLNHSFGDIKSWNPYNPFYSAKKMDILTSYLNTQGAFEDLECKECVWLPLCKGGCPTRRLFYERKCLSFKNNSEDFILEIAKKIKEKNEL